MSGGEKSSGTGDFVIENLVVVEETVDEFVDHETTYDLHPHPSFFLFLLCLGEISKKRTPVEKNTGREGLNHGGEGLNHGEKNTAVEMNDDL